MYLRQHTDTVVLLGPFLDDTDGKTPETALTVASIDVDLYKFTNTHPATKFDITPAAASTPNDMAHVANGVYSLELSGNQLDTCGRLRVTANISGALPVWHDFVVLPQTVYDAIVTASGKVEANVLQWNSAAIATPDSAGYPKVTIKDGTGTGELDTNAGQVAIMAGGITSGSYTENAADRLADKILTRNWVETALLNTPAARSILNALRFLRNKWSISGTTLTVTAEDDSTAVWTAALTADPSGEPITGSDPS